MKKSNQRNNEQGFTLIELLVVVAIVGLLAAIALPEFQNYREKGYETRMHNLVRSARTDLEVYFSENENYVATSAQRGSHGGPTYAYTSYATLLPATRVNTYDYVYVDTRACTTDPTHYSFLVHATNERAKRALRIWKGCTAPATAPYFYTKANNVRW